MEQDNRNGSDRQGGLLVLESLRLPAVCFSCFLAIGLLGCSSTGVNGSRRADNPAASERPLDLSQFVFPAGRRVSLSSRPVPILEQQEPGGRRPVGRSLPVGSSARTGGHLQWRRLQSGVEYTAVELTPPAVRWNGTLHIVRVDPRRAKLVARLAGKQRRRRRTAARWCEDHGLVVAINAGMFRRDRWRNVGYLRNGERVNSRRWLARYRSVLAFGPRTIGAPVALVQDTEQVSAGDRLAGYRTVVQNLRLIRSSADGTTGVSVWRKSRKRWSEAALAVDRKGRLLFLFLRTPYTMPEFNRMVLSLPLGVVRAMHLEGGLEASLSIRAPGLELDLAGSYDTAYPFLNERPRQWRIPNVIGVARKG